LRQYYDGAEGMHRALDTLAALGVHFLVAGRVEQPRHVGVELRQVSPAPAAVSHPQDKAGVTFLTLENLTVPAAYAALFTAIPEFRVDASSSLIRKAQGMAALTIPCVLPGDDAPMGAANGATAKQHEEGHSRGNM